MLENDKVRLTGACNQCGLCCSFPLPGGDVLRCINLIIYDVPGKPFATRCGMHDTRRDGMKIYLVGPDGEIAGESRCHTGAAEIEGIMERGLGNGCSYEIEVKRHG